MKRPIVLQFKLIVGECTENRAFVYAPLELGTDIREISGHLRGPYCSLSTTLPSTYAFSRTDSPNGLNMRALITDPCPWSPDHPMLYHAEIIAELASGETQRFRSTLAIRRLAPRGNSLYLNSKRWVMRGIFDYGPIADVATWRNHASARVIRRHNSPIMSAAAELGLMIVCRLSSKNNALTASIRGVMSPAVAMVVIPKELTLPTDARSLNPNLLLAQEISTPGELQSWAHVAWMKVDDMAEFAERSASINIPIIVERRYRGDSLPEARDAIDTLQADLAPIGQFAGYVV